MTIEASQVEDGSAFVSFTFSEDVGTSFTVDDIAVSEGTTSGFTGDGTSALVEVTVPTNSVGTVTVDVAAGAFEDAAGNANTDAATLDFDYNTVLSTVLFNWEVDGSIEGFGNLTGQVVVDPTNASNQVAELLKPVTAESWAGATLWRCPGFTIAELPVTPTSATITARVWSPDAGTPFLLKIEQAGTPANATEGTATTTSAEAWETLTWDLSSGVDASFTYDKLSIFPNFGTGGGAVGDDTTYYVDKIILWGFDHDTSCP